MLAYQVLIDGFAISALYGLGAVGFTLMFGVSGVLNLAHGGTMLVAAVVAWLMADIVGRAGGALCGLLAGVAMAFATYFLVVRPIQRSRSIPREETEIFVLTGTLLWGIMIQEAVAYFTTTSPHTVRPLIAGVTDIAGVRTPTNEILTAVLCWATIGGLWLLVNRTRSGKALLAASINPRGLTLLGYELSSIYLLVWAIYGVLAGIAGRAARRLPRRVVGQCRHADRLGVLHRGAGRAGQRVRLAGGGVLRGLPGDDHGLSDLAVVPEHPVAAAAGGGGLRAAAGPAGAALMRGLLRSRLFWGALGALLLAALMPLGVSSYIIGVLIPAYYFAVFAMSWDLLFGFAGEVNFGPTFLVGLGAYGAGILNSETGLPIPVCVVFGALLAVAGGVLLALPALRLSGPYFGLITLVAVLLLQQMVTVFAHWTGGEIGLSIPDVLSIDDTFNYYFALGFMAISGLILFGLSRSASG